MAASFKLLHVIAALIPNFKENPFIGGLDTRRVGKIGDFRRISPFISETVRDRPIVTRKTWAAE